MKVVEETANFSKRSCACGAKQCEVSLFFVFCFSFFVIRLSFFVIRFSLFVFRISLLVFRFLTFEIELNIVF